MQLKCTSQGETFMRLDTTSVGWYGGNTHGTHEHAAVNVAGCWSKAESEINAWIKKDIEHEADGLTGTLVDLVGIEKWTQISDSCLNIDDMGIKYDPDPLEGLDVTRDGDCDDDENEAESGAES